MKINKICNISFQRNIDMIDMHTHDKSIEMQGKDADPKHLSKFLGKHIESNGDTLIVKKVFPSSLDCCLSNNGKFYVDEIKGNKDIIKTYKGTNVDNFLAVCQPGSGNVKNIEKLFVMYPKKFIGLKFHPNGAELPADNQLYDAYLEFAKKHNLPCLFHSDRSYTKIYNEGMANESVCHASKYSRPEQIYTLAKRHPDVPVIMAHMGGPENSDIDATLDVILKSAKNSDAKMYADISWVGIDDYVDGKRPMEKIVNIIKKLKNSESGDLTDRIMFGTDTPIDRFSDKDAEKTYESFVKDIHTALKENFGDEADGIIDKIFYKNADDLFFQKTWVEDTAQNVINNTKKTDKKMAAIIGAGTLAFCGVIALVKARKNKTKNNSDAQIVQNNAQPVPAMNINLSSMPDVFQKIKL